MKRLGSIMQIVGGLAATFGCVLLFGVRMLLAGTPEGEWLLFYSGAFGVLLIIGGILLVFYGEKLEKK